MEYSTGIMRSIDELGRIVLPKEIRRSMRIKFGDSFEFYKSAGGEIVMKRFSPLNQLADFSAAVCESLYSTTTYPAVICDRDTVVSASVQPQTRKLVGASISAELEKFLSVFADSKFSGTEASRQEIPLTSIKGCPHVILSAPIVNGGGVIGCIALLNSGVVHTPPQSESERALLCVARLFSNYLDD